METKLDITLPEWVFLDGNSHLGNTLESRDLLQHIPSYTIMELFLLNEDSKIDLDPSVKSQEFMYTNIFGDTEKHLIMVHFSLADELELDGIIDKAIEYYSLFMEWEDNSLIIEETSKDN